jgi:hypothetical protein
MTENVAIFVVFAAIAMACVVSANMNRRKS